jgi:hypothetical protein
MTNSSVSDSGLFYSGMTLETAGRYFHLWTGYTGGGMVTPDNMIAWGLIQPNGTLQVNLDSVQQPGDSFIPSRAGFYPAYQLSPGSTDVSAPTTMTPQ